MERFSTLYHLPKQMELGLSGLTMTSDLLGIIIVDVITPRISTMTKVPLKTLKKMCRE